MKVEVDLEALAAEVRKVAAENPDYVYPENNCVYFDREGQPSCIVGHGLYRLGVTADDLEVEDDSDLVRVENAENVWGLFRGLSSQSLDWMAEVQWNQDVHIPWGEAVRRADEANK